MAQEKKYVETPLMKQYYAIKTSHPDAILLFRVGDFYEMFGQDAIVASEILGITLTKRANGAASFVELAGFPYHSLNVYLPKLVRAGERVAICEQLEDPKKTKAIVKRGVTELITPGVSFNDEIITSKENNFLASIYYGNKNIGVAFLDITTGEYYAAQGNKDYVEKLLLSFKPKEVLIQKGCREQFFSMFGRGFQTYPIENWNFDHSSGYERLTKLFGVKSLKGYGIESMVTAISAAGAILYYLEYTCHNNLKHITTISRIEEDNYVWLDKYTVRNLEIFATQSGGGRSLIDVIDKSLSPMGGRTLRRYLSLPLKNQKEIESRYDIVDYFMSNQSLSDSVRLQVSQLGDLERLISKVAARRCTPRDFKQLEHGLLALETIKTLLSNSDSAPLKRYASKIDPCGAIREAIAKTICDEPSVLIQKGGVIAANVSMKLDEYRELMYKGKQFLVEMQERESQRTGIPSLKISYNSVFGYYIEVRNSHKDKVPQEWVRKQTLTSAERYITQELKEYEEKIIVAQDQSLQLEIEIYEQLIDQCQNYINPVLQDSSVAGEIDALLSFATISKLNNYCRATICDENIINVKAARHPVIEQMLPVGESYVPNDIYLDSTTQQIIIITGPNMSGKSALLRMTALVVIMAQIGCFVPASQATLGITDRVFTRVGASDNISQGESTFMVEMLESANILNNISPRSLVLLDEIGRGTSTYDGISIAWSMVEYLHESEKGRPKTLFATHYHELNEMEQLYPRIKNYNVEVKEMGNKIMFLRTLSPGGTEHSFGIHVARLAGMPQSVVLRSQEILERLELQREKMSQNSTQESTKIDYRSFAEFKKMEIEDGKQMSLFEMEDPVLYKIRDILKNINPNEMSPYDALGKLIEIKKMV
ncbi:MAG: DNA mismatch repair protein MutS [Rikenellaceae bacterium]